MTGTTSAPWAEITDLDGRDKYRVLGVSYFASAEEIKKAYRELARKHHPDKGGDAASFSAVQDAFETLSSQSRRAVYDEWAKQLHFRYVPHFGGKGGEDMLFSELEKAGLTCNPRTQLVLLCEVCRRPSTKECWTCKMPLCSFCTLKRHWKEGFPLHWPLINSDHMKTQLAKRELEKKRIEDARLLDMEDSNWRSEAQLKNIRSFKVAASKMLEREDRLVCYEYALARFYMWAQTAENVHIVIHIPSGYEDQDLDLACNEHVLRIQPPSSPPVLERALDGRFDTRFPITSFRYCRVIQQRDDDQDSNLCKGCNDNLTKDNRTLVVSFRKAEVGTHWPHLFKGDSDGVRSLQPLYRIEETERDVCIEADLPYWVDAEDVDVKIGTHRLEVTVAGSVSCKRTYWAPQEERSRKSFQAVDLEGSMWSLDSGTDAAGEKCAVLLIILLKPEASEEEQNWKRGQRQDNLNAERHEGGGKRGFRFFEDDEDEFGLEDILQALCFMEAGEVFVPAKPWVSGQKSRTIKTVEGLSLAAQTHLKALKKEADSSI